MSVTNKDILEHLIPFQETGFNTSEAEYAHKTAQCLKELIALRAELERVKAHLAIYVTSVHILDEPPETAE